MARSKADATKIDLDALDRDELLQLDKDIKRALATLEKRRRNEALVEMEQVAQKYGLSVKDMIQPGSGKVPSPPKFRHPENPSLTWSGRGRQPTWYKEAVEAGADPDDLRTA